MKTNDMLLIGAGVLGLALLSKGGFGAPTPQTDNLPTTPALSQLSAGFASGINGVTGTTARGDFTMIEGAGNFSVVDAITHNDIEYRVEGWDGVPGYAPNVRVPELKVRVRSFQTGQYSYLTVSDALAQHPEFRGLI